MQRDLAGQAAALSAFLDDPQSVIAVRAPEAATGLVEVQACVIVLACFAIGMLAGWLSTGWLAWRHRTARAGERSLSIDVIVVLFALPVILLLATSGESLNLIAGGLLGPWRAASLLLACGLQAATARSLAMPGVCCCSESSTKPAHSQDLIEALEDRWRCRWTDAPRRAVQDLRARRR